MNVSIHNITSMSLRHEQHWKDHPDLEFYVLSIKLYDSNGGASVIQLFSPQPFVLEQPELQVFE